LCGPCAGVTPLDRALDRYSPGIARAGALYLRGKGFRKIMNTVYAMIYIVAAALVVTGVFLVVTSLMT
jgi:hypothetical protein